MIFDVPPTLVSFAVDVAKIQDVITPELKKAGNKLVWLRAPKDQYDLPDYAGIMDQYEKLHKDMQDGKLFLLMHLTAMVLQLQLQRWHLVMAWA